MKALVLLDSVAQVPSKFKNELVVVTQSNWKEIILFLEGKTGTIRLFLHENCPYDNLLKAVEDYKGSLAVYITTDCSTMFLSRFTHVVNRKEIKINEKFGQGSELSQEFSKLVRSLS